MYRGAAGAQGGAADPRAREHTPRKRGAESVVAGADGAIFVAAGAAAALGAVGAIFAFQGALGAVFGVQGVDPVEDLLRGDTTNE